MGGGGYVTVGWGEYFRMTPPNLRVQGPRHLCATGPSRTGCSPGILRFREETRKIQQVRGDCRLSIGTGHVYK